LSPPGLLCVYWHLDSELPANRVLSTGRSRCGARRPRCRPRARRRRRHDVGAVCRL